MKQRIFSVSPHWCFCEGSIPSAGELEVIMMKNKIKELTEELKKKHMDVLQHISSLIETKEALRKLRGRIDDRAYEVGSQLMEFSPMRESNEYPQILVDSRGVRFKARFASEVVDHYDYFLIELLAIDFDEKLYNKLIPSNEFVKFLTENGFSVWTEETPFMEKKMSIDRIDTQGWTFIVHTQNGFAISIEPFTCSLEALTKRIRETDVNGMTVYIDLVNQIDSLRLETGWSRNIPLSGNVCSVVPQFERNTNFLDPEETVLRKAFDGNRKCRRIYDFLKKVVDSLMDEEREYELTVEQAIRRANYDMQSEKLHVMYKNGVMIDIAPCVITEGQVDMTFGMVVGEVTLAFESQFDWNSLTEITPETKCLMDGAEIVRISDIKKKGAFHDSQFKVVFSDGTVAEAVICNDRYNDAHRIAEHLRNGRRVIITRYSKSLEDSLKHIHFEGIGDSNVSYLTRMRTSVIDDNGNEDFGALIEFRKFYKDKVSALAEIF